MAMTFAHGETGVPRRSSVSDTANITAWGRSFSDIPFAPELFHAAFDAARLREEDPQAYQHLETISRGIAPQVEARFYILDDLWFRTRVTLPGSRVEQRITQVVEVASGLSSRGLSVTSYDPSIRYVELDLPHMIKRKKAAVKAVGERPYNLHFVEGDALDIGNLKNAFNVGRFDNTKPVAVINEGLMRYFPFPAKTAYAQHVARVLNWFSGVWLTTDITLRSVMEAEDRHNPGQNDELGRLSGMDLRANAFESVEEGREFFQRLGFSVHLHRYTEVKDMLVTPERVGVSMKDAEGMIAAGVAVVMVPQLSDKSVKLIRRS